MISAIKKYVPASVGVALVAVLSFVAGQIVPSYFDYASEQRASIAELIEAVEVRGDALEKAIPPVMSAALHGGSRDQAIEALNDRLLDLFQAVEYVHQQFPETGPEKERYVKSLVQLRTVSGSVVDPLSAPEFVEAASEFKNARTTFETKVAALEPNFIGSLFYALH